MVSSQPTFSQSESSQPAKLIHYTPQSKLQLIRLFIEHGERFLVVESEDEFWRDIQALFGPMAGSTTIDRGGIRRKVLSLVADRKATIKARARLSGVVIAATTDFEQALDAWIELVNRRLEEKQRKKSRGRKVRIHKLKQCCTSKG